MTARYNGPSVPPHPRINSRGINIGDYIVNIKLTNTGEELDETAQDTGAELAAVTPKSNAETGNGNGEATAPATVANGDDGNNLKAEVKKVFSEIAAIGREYGSGKKALMNLALKVTEAAQNQIIKSVKGEKDPIARKLYTRFRENSDRRAVTDTGVVIGAESSEGSVKAQVSKLNTFIKFGNEYRDDAVTILELAADVHGKLMANETDRKMLKLTSTYSALVSVAREQLKEERKGQPMTEEELQQLFLGDEPKAKTGADFVEQAIRAIRSAQKGKAPTDNDPAGRDPVEHDGLDVAMTHLRQALADIDPDRFNAMVTAEQKQADAEAKAATEEAMAEMEQEQGEAAAE